MPELHQVVAENEALRAAAAQRAAELRDESLEGKSASSRVSAVGG